jgi:general L-amino acid transport system ATP-binding protein
LIGRNFHDTVSGESTSTQADSAEPVIVAQDVEKWYDNGFHVLKGVSMTVYRGEVLVVMGPSGSGKSTFIRTFNALEPYQKGV